MLFPVFELLIVDKYNTSLMMSTQGVVSLKVTSWSSASRRHTVSKQVGLNLQHGSTESFRREVKFSLQIL